MYSYCLLFVCSRCMSFTIFNALNKKMMFLSFFRCAVYICCIMFGVTEQQQNKRTFEMIFFLVLRMIFFCIRCHNRSILIKHYLGQNSSILRTVFSRHFKIFWHITGMHGFKCKQNNNSWHVSAQNILHHTLCLQPFDNTTLSIFVEQKHFIYYSSL